MLLYPVFPDFKNQLSYQRRKIIALWGKNIELLKLSMILYLTMNMVKYRTKFNTSYKLLNHHDLTVYCIPPNHHDLVIDEFASKKERRLQFAFK